MGSPGTRWDQAGRSLRWRVGVFVAGLVVAGYGVALLVWPRILLWSVAAVFVGLGAVLLLSAVLARGRHAHAGDAPPASREPPA